MQEIGYDEDQRITHLKYRTCVYMLNTLEYMQSTRDIKRNSSHWSM